MTTPLQTADAVYSSYPAIFDALTIADVVDVRPSANVQKIVAYAGGLVTPDLIAEVNREPVVDLTAQDMETILDAVDIMNGLACSSAVKIQYQLRADGGTFSGAGNHMSLSTAKGFLHVVSIDARQDDQNAARIALKFWALKTSSNPPLIVNISQNLTDSPNVSALFKLGPVTFEGSALGGVQSVSIKTGLEYKPFRAGGSAYAGDGYIRKKAPTIEIETTNLKVVSAIGMGITGMSSGISVGLAKMGYALTDAEHVLCGLAAGSYEITDAGVSGEGDAMAKITATGAGALTALTGQALA